MTHWAVVEFTPPMATVYTRTMEWSPGRSPTMVLGCRGTTNVSEAIISYLTIRIADDACRRLSPLAWATLTHNDWERV